MVDMEMRAWARLRGMAQRTVRRPAAPVARSAPDSTAVAGRAPGCAAPVVLATLRSAPFDAGAADLAIDLALDTTASLVVLNVVEMPVGRAAHGDQGDPPDVARALAAPGVCAEAGGVAATVLRVRSPRPLGTLLQLIGDLGPAAVVFGADRDRLSRARPLSRRAHRRAARVLAARTSCLLWVPDAAPAAPPVRPNGRGGGRRPPAGLRR